MLAPSCRRFLARSALACPSSHGSVIGFQGGIRRRRNCGTGCLLHYFCRCVSADAAADFAAFEELGLLNTFDAMVATRADVFSFRAPMCTSNREPRPLS